MTNALLSGLSILFIFRLFLPLFSVYQIGMSLDEAAYFVNIGLVIITAGFWKWSRQGHTQAAAIGVLALLYLEALSLSLQWSFEFPMAILMYTVVVLSCGVLLSARYALTMTVIVGITLLTVSYLQVTEVMNPSTYWLAQDFQISDAGSYVAVLFVIALATWLMNSETKRSFVQVLESEAAIAKERDELEHTLRIRSQELEDMQLVRSLELQRFAAFGRLSANLLHEIANPLTAATLHLESYTGASSSSVKNARRSLRQLERYMVAARNQLKVEGNSKPFHIKHELQRVNIVMKPLAKKSNISLVCEIQDNPLLVGDPIKFNQIMSNLIANAIDAYNDAPQYVGHKQILILAKQSHSNIIISVKDWGVGIDSGALEHIFQPFYSTKNTETRGLGIGLAMVKHITESDFHGKIDARSSPRYGTRFVMKIPIDRTI